MKLYKLTDENDRTYGGYQWGEVVVHCASGTGDLCGPGWLHAYTDPLLAVLLNPVHANFDHNSMHLWECEGNIERTDCGLKIGTTQLRTVRKLSVPHITTEQRIRFAILCAKHVCYDQQWNRWADNWLNRKDRTATAAEAARAAARAAAWAARAAAEAAKAATAAWAAEGFNLLALARQAIEETTI